MIRMRMHAILYQLKGLRFLFYVPFLLIDVLIPILCLQSYFAKGISISLYQTISEFTQMLIPILSVWWLIFAFREYIESEGNELLFLYANRIKLVQGMILFCLFLIAILPIYILSIFLFPNFIFEFIKIVMVCVFYFGLAYLLIFLTGSTAITWMVVFIYTVANTVFYKRQAIFPLYYSLQEASLSGCLKFYLPLMLVGILFLLLGVHANKKWKKYS